MAVLLALVTMALYWPATRYDFVDYDDDMYVIANAHVNQRTDLGKLDGRLERGYAANWHPFTWLSHMLDCQMFGLKPWGHHLTNVLLHALNAGLVFALLQLMTGATWRSSVGGGVVRPSPAARRIGGLGGGTQGCPQRLLRSARADCLRPLRARQNAECRMQKCRSPRRSPNSQLGNTQHASRFTFHCFTHLLFYLLSLFFFALGPDEQADAGDVAVRDVAAGLLAAGENAECKGHRHAPRPRTTPTRTFHVSRFTSCLSSWRSFRSLSSRCRRAS